MVRRRQVGAGYVGIITSGMNFEQAIKELQDTLVVVTEIQRRQAAVQRDQAEAIVQHDQWLAQHRQTMAEMDEKLGALITIVDGWIRKPPQ
jgi:galactokinase/mevalonate kinase-like predicted kinase